jgi:hypothetical protein
LFNEKRWSIAGVHQEGLPLLNPFNPNLTSSDEVPVS